jgi:hypothetical protein
MASSSKELRESLTNAWAGRKPPGPVGKAKFSYRCRGPAFVPRRDWTAITVFNFPDDLVSAGYLTMPVSGSRDKIDADIP